MSKEKYEKIYSEHECAFGTEPISMVKKALEYIGSGKAVELGAGEGRNSLFLAEHGFQVTAIDESPAAIEKIQRFAADKNIELDTRVGDVRTFEIPQGEDLILAILLFHHFSRSEALETIEKMKGATREGGLNIVSVITKDSDFYRNHPDADRFYVESGELKELYKDWEILESDSRRWKAHQKHPDGSPMVNTVEELVARKSSQK